MAERESPQPRTSGLRRRDLEPAQLGLSHITASHRKVIEAARTKRDRLGDPEHELGVRQPSGPLLQRHTAIDGIAHADGAGRGPQQLRAAVSSHRAPRGPNAYAHLRSGLLCPANAVFDNHILPGQEAFFADARPHDQSLTRGSE